MTELKNCKRCGRVFESANMHEMCISCTQRDEMDFRRIKEYLYLHPFAKIFEVSMDLDISIRKIKYYLREGRIEIVEKNNHFLKCDLCGCSICSGCYCDECSKKATHKFKSTYVGDDPLKVSHSINYLPRNKSTAKRAALG